MPELNDCMSDDCEDLFSGLYVSAPLSLSRAQDNDDDPPGADELTEAQGG